MSRAYFNDDDRPKRSRAVAGQSLEESLRNAVLEWNRARRTKLDRRYLRNRLMDRCGERGMTCYHRFGIDELEKWCRFCRAAESHHEAYRQALIEQRVWGAAVRRYADRIDGLGPKNTIPRKPRRVMPSNPPPLEPMVAEWGEPNF